MAVDLSTLLASFREQVEQILGTCLARGLEMRPYSAVRTPFDQARLWRQSRSIEEIRDKIDDLRAGGADFLAHCLESVGPQHGEPVTNALPGFSWHQWGEAVDCFWVVNGKAEWSTSKKVNGVNGYRVYADEVEQLGLTAGGHWPKFKDWPHAQLRTANHPGTVMPLQQIEEIMKERFG